MSCLAILSVADFVANVANVAIFVVICGCEGFFYVCCPFLSTVAVSVICLLLLLCPPCVAIVANPAIFVDIICVGVICLSVC